MDHHLPIFNLFSVLFKQTIQFLQQTDEKKYLIELMTSWLWDPSLNHKTEAVVLIKRVVVWLRWSSRDKTIYQL